MIFWDKWLYIPSFEVVLNKYRLIFYKAFIVQQSV